MNLTGSPLVSLSGSGDFSVLTQPSSPVSAGGSTTFQIRFTPSSPSNEDVKTTTVSIANNDSDENPYNFTIQGKGVDALWRLSSDVPKPIPDVSTVVSTLSVTGLAGSLSDVDVRVSITHTYDSDLDVYLISPLGTRVELFTDVGGGGDNFDDTILDDAAAAGIGSGTAPFAGRYRPEGLLSALNGQNPNGTWQLEITDDAGADIGTLQIWGLRIATAAAPEITVLGNSVSIADGDTTPSSADDTDFGTAVQGAAPVSHTFTVRNDGTATLTLGAVTVPAGYTLTEGLTSSLAPGASDTFTVHFETAATGTKTGEITFATNDPDENPFHFTITGMVVLPQVTITVTPVSALPAETPLRNGVPMRNLSGAATSEQFFQLDVPSSVQTLEITISGGTGDADLYVKRGSEPTTSSYDYRPYLVGNNETVGVLNPSAGTWFVMVRGYQAFAGVTLQATYSPEQAAVVEDSPMNLVYTITRSAADSSPLTVSFAVGGTATYATDYTATGATSLSAGAGTVTIAAGRTMATVTVDPTGDTVEEPNETVVLTLVSGTGYTVGNPSVATGTLEDAAVAMVSQWASTVLGCSSQYAASPAPWSSARALGAPDVTIYRDDPNAWAPSVGNGTTEWIALGYTTPVYATGVRVRESYGNGAVTKIELRDHATGAWQPVWSGLDATAPGAVADLAVVLSPTSYLVDGVRVTLDMNHSSAWEELDAVALEGVVPMTVAQWASRVLGYSSQYAASPTPWSSSRALGSPDVTLYRDDPNAWAPSVGNGTTEWIALGYTTPVYATGVRVRESYGNGAVTKIELRDHATGTWQSVWSGVDATAPGAVADLAVVLSPTSYLVDGVRVTLDMNHSSAWEELDAVALEGVVPTTVAQWASSVLGYSSQYAASPGPWSSSRALGAPDVTVYRDDPNSWAPSVGNGTTEWIALGYTNPVYATAVRVRESYGNGAVTKIELRDHATGAWQPVWSGVDATAPGAVADLAIAVSQTRYLVDGVRVTLDMNHSSAWEELDAVALEGVVPRTASQWASTVVGCSSEYAASPAAWSSSRALRAPDVTIYRDDPNAWAPSVGNGTTEWIALGYTTPVYATGVRVRESYGNGAVTKIELRDHTAGTWQAVWSGVDATVPGAVSDLAVPLSTTSFLVDGVRITLDMNHSSAWEEVDAVALEGVVPTTASQWASSVLGYSSQYAASPGAWSSSRALGAPDVTVYRDDPNAWAPSVANGTTEWIALGYTTPVYATAVRVRESYGNGAVTKIELRDHATGTWQPVWSGVDATAPGAVADLAVTLSPTSYLVDGVRITLDMNHSSAWEEIDAVALEGEESEAYSASSGPTSFVETPDTGSQSEALNLVPVGRDDPADSGVAAAATLNRQGSRGSVVVIDGTADPISARAPERLVDDCRCADEPVTVQAPAEALPRGPPAASESTSNQVIFIDSAVAGVFSSRTQVRRASRFSCWTRGETVSGRSPISSRGTAISPPSTSSPMVHRVR